MHNQKDKKFRTNGTEQLRAGNSKYYSRYKTMESIVEIINHVNAIGTALVKFLLKEKSS